MLADHYQSKTNVVATPRYLLDILTKEFGQMFDPCPLNPNFNIDKDSNGLTIRWKKTNYCNPPYGCSKPWVEKARLEQKSGNTTILLLKLTSLGTQYIKCFASTAELRIFSHHLYFPGYEGRARFTNVLLIFHGDNKRAGTVTYISHRPTILSV